MQLSLTFSLAVVTVSVSAQKLQSNLIQKASSVTGQQGNSVKDGQVKSDTSDENFINICAGKTLTNGLQNKAGSCNGIPMGEIPSTQNMVSTIITFPKTGATVPADQSFDIKVKTTNLVTGSFTNPDNTYYSAPQKLQGGKIVGHTHVTVQNMGNTINPQNPLNAQDFAFFKGINTVADGQGILSATVTGGLPAGVYRVCTLSSAANHQAVIMPVAQRGAQDDCTKFEVTSGGGNKNSNNNDNNKDNNAKNNQNGNNNNKNGNTVNNNGNKDNNNNAKNKNTNNKTVNNDNKDRNKNEKDADAKSKDDTKPKEKRFAVEVSSKRIAGAPCYREKKENIEKRDAETFKGLLEPALAVIEKTEGPPDIIIEGCRKLSEETRETSPGTTEPENAPNFDKEIGSKIELRNHKRFSRVFMS